MKIHTTEEIQRFINQIWPRADNKSVDLNTPEKVMITASSMYDPPALNFELLCKFSEFFDTKKINDDDRFSQAGCETCDYGSCYGFTLTIYA